MTGSDSPLFFSVGGMVAKARKMVGLQIEETSGVDHPAHLHEGWLVMKSADASDVEAVLDAIVDSEEGETMPNPDETVVEEAQPVADEVSEQQPEQTIEALEKALAEAEARIAELEKAVAEATTEEVVDVPVEDDIVKSAPEPLRKMLEDMQKAAEDASARAVAAESELRKEREDRADAASVEMVKSLANLSLDADVVGPALRRLADTDAELAKAVEEMLTSVNAQAESAHIFAEIGKSAPATGDAYSRLQSMAKAAVDAGEAKTVEQAIAKVAFANPELYNQYLAEKGV